MEANIIYWGFRDQYSKWVKGLRVQGLGVRGLRLQDIGVEGLRV